MEANITVKLVKNYTHFDSFVSPDEAPVAISRRSIKKGTIQIDSCSISLNNALGLQLGEQRVLFMEVGLE